MGNEAGKLERVINENKVTEGTVISTSLMTHVLEELGGKTGLIDKPSAKKFLLSFFKALHVAVSVGEINYLLTLCMKEEKFSFKEFRAIVTRILPQSQLSSAVLMSTNYYDDNPQPPSVIGCISSATYLLGNNGCVWKFDNKFNPPEPQRLPNTSNITQIACGTSHVLFLDYYGTVRSMGSGVYGKLGLGDSFTRGTPKRIDTLPVISYVACGENHSCFIDEEDHVWVAGSNTNGQLGMKTANNTCEIPQMVKGLHNIKVIQCGGNHTIALSVFSSCWVTGANSQGQLGLGNTKDQNSFVQLPGGNYRAISCGMNYSLFLDMDGFVFSCGNNEYGQLGLAKEKEFSTSLKGIRIENTEIIQISCQQYHSLCVDSKGGVWTFGRNNFGQLGLGDQIDQRVPQKIRGQYDLLCNGLSEHSVLFSDQGSSPITVFGRNKELQLGISTGEDQVISPVEWNIEHSRLCEVRDSEDPSALAAKQKNRFRYYGEECEIFALLRKLKISGSTILSRELFSELLNNFVDDNGIISKDKAKTVFYVLMNELNFPLEIKTIEDKLPVEGLHVTDAWFLKELLPTHRLSWQCQMLTANQWTSADTNAQLCSGDGYFVYCEEDGATFGFGERYFKRIDDSGNFVPILVPLLNNIQKVLATTNNVLCIDKDGQVWEFDPEWAPRTGVLNWKQNPVLMPSLPAVVSISCGITHTVFIAADLTVWGKGSNKQGQLGFGYTETLKEFRKIPDVSAAHVICGETCTFLLSNKGSLRCSGWNICGQLGTGDKEDFRSFVEVAESSNISTISCGNQHTIFLLDDGTVYSCGTSKLGALGLGSEISVSLTPQRIELPPIQKISCAKHQTYCLDNEGKIWAFGQNEDGSLGFDDISNHCYPDCIEGIPPMVSISSFAFTKNTDSVLAVHYDQPILLRSVEGEYWSFPPAEGRQLGKKGFKPISLPLLVHQNEINLK